MKGVKLIHKLVIESRQFRDCRDFLLEFFSFLLGKHSFQHSYLFNGMRFFAVMSNFILLRISYQFVMKYIEYSNCFIIKYRMIFGGCKMGKNSCFTYEPELKMR